MLNRGSAPALRSTVVATKLQSSHDPIRRACCYPCAACTRARAADAEGNEQHGSRADNAGAAQPRTSPGGNSHDAAQGGAYFSGAEHVRGPKQRETESDRTLTSRNQQRDCDEIDDRERSRDDCQECSRAVLDSGRHPACREISIPGEPSPECEPNVGDVGSYCRTRAL